MLHGTGMDEKRAKMLPSNHVCLFYCLGRMVLFAMETDETI